MADNLKTTTVKGDSKQEQSAEVSKNPNATQLPADGSGQQTATSAAQLEAANRSVEEARSTHFGDTTSSNSNANEDGRHGRDGGSTLSEPQAGSPNNPAASAQTVGDAKDAPKSGDNNDAA